MKTTLCLALAVMSGLGFTQLSARAAGQNWSATPTGTNAAGQYLLATGANWGGTAPTGSGDRMRFGGLTSGTLLFNDFADDTAFSFLFEYHNQSYTFYGNRIDFRGINNSNGTGSTQTFNLDMILGNDAGVSGNGNFTLNGTLKLTATKNLLPTLSGTMSIRDLDLNGFTLRLGYGQEKGANWTGVSSALSTTVIGSVASGAAGEFQNHSLGKVILTGSNNLANATVLGNQSFTEFRYAADDDRKLAVNKNLQIYNGTLLLTGGTITEQVNQFTIGYNQGWGVGETRVVRNGGSASIMINSLSRAEDYTLNVSDNNLFGAATNVFGSVFADDGPSLIAQTWVTIGARDWAVYDAGTHYLRALTGSEYTAFNSANYNRSVHSLLTAGAALTTADWRASTLKIDSTAGAGTLDLNGGKLTLYGGGLMLTGGNDFTISSGTIWGSWDTSPARQTLNIWNDSAGALDLPTLASITHLTKSGTGTLILSGSNQFVTYDGKRMFTVSSGTVILNHDYALRDEDLNFYAGTGGLDLNGHDAAVHIFSGQPNGRFTLTNSGAMADLVVGKQDGTSGSEWSALATSIISGNVRLVLQGDSGNNLTFVNPNTSTGGVKILGNGAIRTPYYRYRLNLEGKEFGPRLELGDNGGFGVASNWNNWNTPVTISGSNTFIFAEEKNLNATGVWDGGGDIEFRNSTINQGVQFNLAANLADFTGTVKFSGARYGSTAAENRAASHIVSGSALLTGGDATYNLWRAADGGNASSRLNVTLQLKGVGSAYDVHIGDLTSGNGSNSDARMNGGIATDLTQGVVANNTANSTATLLVGSANHGYSEFAERIIDTGILNSSGAIQDAQTNAKIAVTKVGTGTWALSGSNSYSGATTVSGGVLLLSGSGQINSSASVSVSGAALVNNSSVVLDRAVTLGADGILGGSGTVSGALTVSDASGGFTGGAVGDIGTLTISSALTLGNFTYQFDLVSESEHDLLNFSGGLTLSGGAYTVNLNALGSPADFSNLVILNGLNTGDLAKWSLDPTAQAAGYSLDISGNQLLLNYAVQIPEPSAWALLLSGAALLFTLRRRR